MTLCQLHEVIADLKFGLDDIRAGEPPADDWLDKIAERAEVAMTQLQALVPEAFPAT